MSEWTKEIVTVVTASADVTQYVFSTRYRDGALWVTLEGADSNNGRVFYESPALDHMTAEQAAMLHGANQAVHAAFLLALQFAPPTV